MAADPPVKRWKIRTQPLLVECPCGVVLELRVDAKLVELPGEGFARLKLNSDSTELWSHAWGHGEDAPTEVEVVSD
jgi:hypothetical protein